MTTTRTPEQKAKNEVRKSVFRFALLAKEQDLKRVVDNCRKLETATKDERTKELCGAMMRSATDMQESMQQLLKQCVALEDIL